MSQFDKSDDNFMAAKTQNHIDRERICVLPAAAHTHLMIKFWLREGL
jgi:hypothetical protein